MITILHGESVLASREKLEFLKKKHLGEILLLDGNKTDLTTLRQALESSSMFTSDRLVIVENLLSGKNKNRQAILAYLRQNLAKSELILWEETETPKSLLAQISPPAKALLFKREPFLFKFLESLRPGNQPESLKLLLEGLKNEEPQFVFYMLVRQLRLLLLLKNGIISGSQDLVRLAPWQKEKLSRQARYFSQEKLLKLHQNLAKIDYEQKTGQAVFNLSQTLELFLTSL